MERELKGKELDEWMVFIAGDRQAEAEKRSAGDEERESVDKQKAETGRFGIRISPGLNKHLLTPPSQPENRSPLGLHHLLAFFLSLPFINLRKRAELDAVNPRNTGRRECGTIPEDHVAGF